MTTPNRTLCYTVDPKTESTREKRQREYAAKIAEEKRLDEEALGLCRCSTEDGEFLRMILPDGCPNHTRKGRFILYPELVNRLAR